MDKSAMIVITGASGFIGSCLVGFLNQQGFGNLILVDEFSDDEKELNLHLKKYAVRVEREAFFDWLSREKPRISFVFHLGARTDTAEFDYSIHQHLNVEYSQKIWNYCAAHEIPLVYASSAATYGAGELGYDDDHAKIEALAPLNPYGISKNEFDKWALRQAQGDTLRKAQGDTLQQAQGDTLQQAQGDILQQAPRATSPTVPPVWAGLKFFNVYGPNEYHKARMASMVYHSFKQVIQNGEVKLFKSNQEKFKDGAQLRDFIYVKDILKICFWLLDKMTAKDTDFESGIYNAGTGHARTFNDLVNTVFKGLALPEMIRYIEMPDDIKDKYQYFTEANVSKLRSAGYVFPLYSLEDGVGDYVKNYLKENLYY
ncbi:MAG: NAD-dependent epimerase/dehydratase family protein [Ginsengibacter sp.]